MNMIDNEITGLKMKDLSLNELDQLNGGSWLSDTAEFVGFAIGFTAHAVVDAVLIVTGNFGPHN